MPDSLDQAMQRATTDEPGGVNQRVQLRDALSMMDRPLPQPPPQPQQPDSLLQSLMMLIRGR